MNARSIVVAVAIMFATTGLVSAENPEQAFKGKIMCSNKRFPQTAKSPSAYTAMIRKQAQSNFVEDSSGSLRGSRRASHHLCDIDTRHRRAAAWAFRCRRGDGTSALRAQFPLA